MISRTLLTMVVLGMLAVCVPLVANAEEKVEKVEVKLTMGNSSASVNGEAVKVQQPPVKKNGTTLIPLNVVAKAFGIVPAIKKDMISLQYNSAAVELKLGSKAVKINGVGAKLAMEPQNINSVTMVPVRLFSDYFGAAIVLNGNNLTIMGLKGTGYTKVGDSYYGWSMNYPIGVSVGYFSDRGDRVIWRDDAGNSVLIVDVIPADEFDTTIKMNMGDVLILEKTLIDVQGQKFDKWLVKDDGRFYEYRMARKGDYIYMISAGGGETYTRSRLLKYQSQLNSFSLSFSKSASKLKDMTRIRNGNIIFQDSDYGLQVDLPMNWERDDISDYPLFKGDEGTVEVFVVSASGNETAEQWSERMKDRLGNRFGFIENVLQYPISLNKGKGNVLQYDYKIDEHKWVREYTIYYVSGKHKYEVVFDSLITTDSLNSIHASKKLFESIASSIRFDTENVDSSLGYIEDKSIYVDETVRISNQTDGYAIELPAAWDNIDEKGIVYGTIPRTGIYFLYSKSGGIASEEAHKLSEFGFQTTEIEWNGAPAFRMEWNGTPAYRMDWDGKIRDDKVLRLIYLFDHEGVLYELVFEIKQANDTAAFRSDAEKVVQSLTFTP